MNKCYFKLLQRSCLSLAVLLATSANAEFLQNSPLLDQHALGLQGQRFEFSTDGGLVKGPVRGEGDPIDYSSLLKEPYIKGGFENSVFGCFPNVEYCEQVPRRYETKNLKLGVYYEAGSVSEDGFDAISAIGDKSLAELGFNVEATPDKVNANIVLVIGSLEYISQKLSERSDRFGEMAIDQLEQSRDRQSIFSNLRAKLSTPSFCYVSGKSWAERQTMFVYLTPTGIETCLSQSFMTTIGLYPTAFDIPSLLNSELGYSSATFADVLFVRLLYHDEFPEDAALKQVQQFWTENAVDVWLELLEEDMGS